MIARSYRNIRERLTLLEAQLKPPGRVFVFFRVEKPDLPPYAEHLAAFRTTSTRTTPFTK
jgi:hypothetical protein